MPELFWLKVLVHAMLKRDFAKFSAPSVRLYQKLGNLWMRQIAGATLGSRSVRPNPVIAAP